MLVQAAPRPWDLWTSPPEVPQDQNLMGLSWGASLQGNRTSNEIPSPECVPQAHHGERLCWGPTCDCGDEFSWPGGCSLQSQARVVKADHLPLWSRAAMTRVSRPALRQAPPHLHLTGLSHYEVGHSVPRGKDGSARFPPAPEPAPCSHSVPLWGGPGLRGRDGSLTGPSQDSHESPFLKLPFLRDDRGVRLHAEAVQPEAQ